MFPEKLKLYQPTIFDGPNLVDYRIGFRVYCRMCEVLYLMTGSEMDNYLRWVNSANL